MHFVLCKEQQHSQKKELFMSAVKNDMDRTLKKALSSHHLPSDFVKWREIAADRNS
jgi:hypothetical protein